MDERKELLEAKQEELDRLTSKRYIVNSRIRKLRKDLGLNEIESPPPHECKRCGYHWLGRIIHRLPCACPRCHSALWNEEPTLVNREYKPPRKPSDPPNPKWRPSMIQQSPELPPPPRPRTLSLSEQLQMKIKETVDAEPESTREKVEPVATTVLAGDEEEPKESLSDA